MIEKHANLIVTILAILLIASSAMNLYSMMTINKITKEHHVLPIGIVRTFDNEWQVVVFTTMQDDNLELTEYDYISINLDAYTWLVTIVENNRISVERIGGDAVED